jgi:hypothetical protein
MSGTNFTIKTAFGDSAGPTYSGNTVVAPPAAGNNPVQINQLVAHNASVVPANEPTATTYDVTICAHSFTVAEVIAMGFTAVTSALNSNTGTQQVYVKLKGAGAAGVDVVIALQPGNAAAFASAAAAGMVSACTSIMCTPDPISDIQILGTLELTV